MVSDTYRRRRRLALFIIALSVAFLVAGYYFGYFLEAYSRPRAVAGDEGLRILHESRAAGEDVSGSVVVLLDPAFGVQTRIKLLGDCRAAIPDGEELILFFENRYAVIRDRQTVRGADLPQDWGIRTAARGPDGDVWIFGIRDGRIVARRRTGRIFGEELVAIDPRGDVEELAAAPGPAVLWRIRGTGLIRAAAWNGTAFEPFAELSIPPNEPWGATVQGRRLLVVTQRREDREFGRVNLRLHCCASCGLAPPPEVLSLRDPILFLRKVTGLALAVSDETITLVVTRANTIQVARLSAADYRVLTPKLVSVGSEPIWRRTVGALWPLLMLFFSFSLVFLGFTLLRERRKFFLEHLAAEARPAPNGLMPAEILQRAMAHIIDFMILLPVFFVAVEVLSLAPQTKEMDFTDPLALGMLGAFAGLQFLYYFVQEWLFGRTIGKRIIGIRVCREDGSKPGFAGALVRNLLRIVDATFVLAAVGVAFMMITPRRRRLGDVVAKTMVVDATKPDEEEKPEPRALQRLRR